MDSSAHACKHKDTCLRILGCNAYDIKERSTQVSCAVSARAIRSFIHFLFHDISSLSELCCIRSCHPLLHTLPFSWYIVVFETFALFGNYTSHVHIRRTSSYLKFLWWQTYDIRGWSKRVSCATSARAIRSFTRFLFHHFWDICAFRKLYVHMSLSKDLISKFLVYKTYDIGGWSKQVSSTASAADICSFPHFVIPEISSFLKTYKCTVFRKPSGSSDPFRRYYQSAPNISSCSSFTWCPQLRLVAST